VRNFAPAPGRIGAYSEPSGPGVRVDSGVGPGGEVSPMYDPMVAKLIVWDADREQATRRMLRALAEYEIEGLETLIPFHRALLSTRQWADGETCRDLVEDAEWLRATEPDGAAITASAAAADSVEQSYTVEVSGRRFDVKVIGQAGASGAVGPSAPAGRPAPKRGQRTNKAADHADELHSPLQGNVWKVPVTEGQAVEAGEIVTIIEAMKMENEILAHKSGTIVEHAITEGESIAAGDLIAIIGDEEA
jgi:acetyl-CoA/propionyl-CoA carboxylase biotin carboxyl carrier protein